MVRAVIVTHQGLACELVRTAEAILGPQEGVACVSNSDASLTELKARLVAEMGAGDGPVFVFVDLLGGSCGQICGSLGEDRRRIRVVSGVNLPMLIEFFYNRGRVAPGELLERVVTKGREGIQVQ